MNIGDPLLRIDDPLVSGPNAVLDGISNRVRYALGLTPAQPSSAGLPSATLGGAQIDFSYRRLTNPLDLTYSPEASSDLTTWLGGFTPVSVTSNGDGTETVVVRFSAGPRKFLRLRVSSGP